MLLLGENVFLETILLMLRFVTLTTLPFLHPVRCKLRLHFARLFAARLVELVSLRFVTLTTLPFWHPVRCKLRLHFARLPAARLVELVSLRSPTFPVEIAVADSFGNVVALDIFACLKVGDGSGDLHNAVVGTCRQIETAHCSA